MVGAGAAMLDLSGAVEKVQSSDRFQEFWQEQREKPRFTKFQAYYVADANLDTAACENCPWFVPEAQSQTRGGDCLLVEPDGAPDEGVIDPKGTCNLWWAGPARISVQERLRGRGAQDQGLLPGSLRVRVEEFVIPPPRTEPPSTVREAMVTDKELPVTLAGLMQRLQSGSESQ